MDTAAVAERRIPVPRARVWQALATPESLARLLPGCTRLEPRPDGAFAVTVAPAPDGLAQAVDGVARVAEAVVPSRVRLAFTPAGGGPETGATLELFEADAATRVRFQSGGAADRLFAALLDRLVLDLAGTPANVSGADGPVGLVASGSGGAGPLRAMLAAVPAAPLGLPIVAWIGAALYALIFVAIFGAYVF